MRKANQPLPPPELDSQPVQIPSQLKVSGGRRSHPLTEVTLRPPSPQPPASLRSLLRNIFPPGGRPARSAQKPPTAALRSLPRFSGALALPMGPGREIPLQFSSECSVERAKRGGRLGAHVTRPG